MSEKWVFWFKELGQEHHSLVGRKCANLGEMTRMGLSVPHGFALSVEAYKDFMSMTGAAHEIQEYISQSGGGPKDPAQFSELSTKLRRIVESHDMPEEMRKTIVTHYRELCRRCGKPEIAVSTRSAGSVSHPGQYETYLNVIGESAVVHNIKMVWASTFNHRALSFRSQSAMPLDTDPIGVAVLKMVKAKAAGVVFTADPNTGDTSRMIIEANWGLGESVVGGQSTPDFFTVDKDSLEVQEKRLGPKSRCVIPGETGVTEVDTSPEQSATFCLSDDEIKTIARLGKTLEDHFGIPQDIEWAIEQDTPLPDSVVLLQTRAEVIAQKKTPVDQIVDLMLGRLSGNIKFGGGGI